MSIRKTVLINLNINSYLYALRASRIEILAKERKYNIRIKIELRFVLCWKNQYDVRKERATYGLLEADTHKHALIRKLRSKLRWNSRKRILPINVSNHLIHKKILIVGARFALAIMRYGLCTHFCDLSRK